MAKTEKGHPTLIKYEEDGLKTWLIAIESRVASGPRFQNTTVGIPDGTEPFASQAQKNTQDQYLIQNEIDDAEKQAASKAQLNIDAI